MRQLRTRISLGTVLVWTTAGLALGCIPPQVRAELDELKKSKQEMKQEVAELKFVVQQQGAHFENVERSLWSDRYCENPKNKMYAAKISEFLGQLQAQIPGTCSAEGVAAGLVFMNNEPYMVARYHPNAIADDLHLSRLGFLKTKLLLPKYIRPSTRILILVQPAEETAASQERAKEMGRQYIEVLYKNGVLPKPGPRILGPFLLPCRLNAEIRRIYKGPMDGSLPTEPVEGAPQIKIWTFRSDC